MLLTSGADKPPPAVTSAPVPTAPPVKPPPPPTRADLSSVSKQQIQEESQEADDAMDELLRFIAALRIKQMLTKAEADALEELLFENRLVSF